LNFSRLPNSGLKSASAGRRCYVNRSRSGGMSRYRPIRSRNNAAARR
jgi:hypothetical protein